MASQIAPRDPNRNVTIQGVDSVGFTEATNIAVNPTTHAILVESTAAPIVTQDVNITKVNGTAFILGQQLAASSLPIVLTAAQITTLTPPAAITGFATSALQSTQDTSINTLLKPASTLAAVTSLTQMNGVAIAMNTGARAAGVQRVTIATDDIVPASQSGTWTVQPGNTANSTAWLVNDNPVTSGGLSKFHLVGAATDNATNVKASAGQLYSITAFNLNASPRYIKFHNTAGVPTAGAGVTDSFLIPGNTSGAGLVLNIDKGIAFSTGIGITLVTGIADANTTAISASEVLINVYFK